MTVFVNGRFLTQSITGINRFAYELCLHLSRLISIIIIVPNQPICSCYDTTKLNLVKFGKLKSHLWEQVSLPIFFLNKKNYLLLNFSGLGPIAITSKICTIHDVSFLFNPSWFSKTYYLIYKYLTPLIIKTSKLIFTVSQFSKTEIMRFYNVPSWKIKIIYNAVSKAQTGKRETARTHVLTVGSIDPRKNFKILLDAFQDSRIKDVELHVVGAQNRIFGDSYFNVADHSNIKFLGRISDQSLIREYQSARLFILPSLYEGFGIPPLEALTNGCPIALSDIPVFHEIFEDSALYFNPTDEEEIIRIILENQKSKSKISTQIENRVRNKFSWESSAYEVLSAIKELSKQ